MYLSLNRVLSSSFIPNSAEFDFSVLKLVFASHHKPKIRFWEACETAEVAWEETKDDEGQVVQRLPYGNSLEEPQPGNRILANLEQILIWMEA